jgi:hypothetical protein
MKQCSGYGGKLCSLFISREDSAREWSKLDTLHEIFQVKLPFLPDCYTQTDPLNDLHPSILQDIPYRLLSGILFTTRRLSFPVRHLHLQETSSQPIELVQLGLDFGLADERLHVVGDGLRDDVAQALVVTGCGREGMVGGFSEGGIVPEVLASPSELRLD